MYLYLYIDMTRIVARVAFFRHVGGRLVGQPRLARRRGRLPRRVLRRAEMAACVGAAEAAAGVFLVVSDCAAVRGGVAALRRCDRRPIDGEDGVLWVRVRAFAVLPEVRWVRAHLSREEAAAAGACPPRIGPTVPAPTVRAASVESAVLWWAGSGRAVAVRACRSPPLQRTVAIEFAAHPEPKNTWTPCELWEVSDEVAFQQVRNFRG